jgi:hypothetical protein
MVVDSVNGYISSPVVDNNSANDTSDSFGEYIPVYDSLV